MALWYPNSKDCNEFAQKVGTSVWLRDDKEQQHGHIGFIYAKPKMHIWCIVTECLFYCIIGHLHSLTMVKCLDDESSAV